MWTPRVHSFPFQLQAARVEKENRAYIEEGNVMIFQLTAQIVLK